MRGFWLVKNHKAVMARDMYRGFVDPKSAREYASNLGWKEEIQGAFDEDPTGPHTYFDGITHVSILFVTVD